MPAILKAGGTNYFFTSTAQASKALELLSKAIVVDRDYSSHAETYRQIAETDRHEWKHELELKITKQRKPHAPQLCLPGE
jgi:hypothetical protein